MEIGSRSAHLRAHRLEAPWVLALWVALGFCAWRQAPPASAQQPGVLPPPPNAAQVIPQDVVTDIRVVGNSTVELAKIVPYIQSRKGRPYDAQTVLEDVRRLNRSRMFANVSTENRREPGVGLVVIFRVVERPTLQYVKYIGLRNALDKNMEEETNLKIGEPVDPYAVTEGKRKIEEWYKAKGFNLVQVTIIEGTKPSDRGAIYQIHEGPQQQIAGIEFYGSTIVTGSRLKTQIQSGSVWFGYFWGYLDMAKVEEDERTLEKYFKNLGFLTARVRRELMFEESQTYCTLRFVVDEGPRCQINSVRFIGVNKFRVEDIQNMLKLKGGETFDGGLLMRDKSVVEQIYGSYGYIFADVKTEPQVSEDASRMDLVYVIEEGKRYRVADIRPQIEGEKPHTNIRTVLNRIELQPGDIIDVRKLRRSEARLQRSQLFAVDPQRGIRPQIVVQPADEVDGDTMLGGSKKPGGSPLAKRPLPGGVRGQSPDNWNPDDRFIPLHVLAQMNPQAPPQAAEVDDRHLPPPGALPDGRYPPPMNAQPAARGYSALPQGYSASPHGYAPSLKPAAPTAPPASLPYRPWGFISPTNQP